MKSTRKPITAILLIAAIAATAAAATVPIFAKLRFSERTVAGSDKDLMIVRHIRMEGLAVALLADDASQDKMPSPATGLSELTLTRFVLDRCATAKQARALLRNVPYHYSFIPCHYMICDASGDSFVWEITPDLKTRFLVDGHKKPHVVTNHLLGKYGTVKLPEGNTFDRFRRLSREIAGRKSKVTPDEARTINQCVAVPKEAKGAATLWHAVYDLAAKKVSISFFLGRDSNGDRRTPYLDFAFKK